MTTIAVDTAADQALDPLDADPTETARLFQRAAGRLADRARRIRCRVEGLDESLEPLQVAMRRRACELELTSMALSALADGFGARPSSPVATR